MQKRSQVTIFIVLGIVLIFVLGIILFLRDEIFRSELSPKISNDKDGFREIEEISRRCFDDSFIDSLILFSNKGGVYDPIKFSFYDGKKVPHYDYILLNKTINLEFYINHIHSIYDQSFKLCISDSLVKYNVSLEKEFKISLPSNKIKLRINNAIIKSDEDTEKVLIIPKFDHTIKYDLKEVLDKIRGFSSILLNSKELVPLSDLIAYTNRNGFSLSILNLNENTVLYSLKFEDIKDKEFIFRLIWEYPKIILEEDEDEIL